MQHHDETVSNTSNPCFPQILVERLSRRRLLQGGWLRLVSSCSAAHW